MQIKVVLIVVRCYQSSSQKLGLPPLAPLLLYDGGNYSPLNSFTNVCGFILRLPRLKNREGFRLDETDEMCGIGGEFGKGDTGHQVK